MKHARSAKRAIERPGRGVEILVRKVLRLSFLCVWVEVAGKLRWFSLSENYTFYK